MAGIHSKGVDIRDVANYLGCDLRMQNDRPFEITGVSDLTNALPNELVFVVQERYLSLILSSQAQSVIISPALYSKLPPEAVPRFNWILHEDPYVAYAKVTQLFYASKLPSTTTIHATAVIHPSVQLGRNISIGPYVVIGEGSIIGDESIIESHTSIGNDCRIGKWSHLYPRVTIYHQCELGKGTVIHSGCVIGADGFGFAFDKTQREPNPSWTKIIQIGAVKIGDWVEIGANTTIDRGSIQDTVIGNGCKIDNLVQIGHNVRIGSHTVIAGHTGVAGSADIGSFCVIGGGVGIAGHIRITDKVTIAGGSNVGQSIETPGVYASGSSAIPYREWQKNVITSKNLYRMSKKIQSLEKRLEEK